MAPHSDTKTSCASFTDSDLGTTWRNLFGAWRVRKGWLCHVLPGGEGAPVPSVISGTEGMNRLALYGVVRHVLPAGGADRVRIGLTVKAATREELRIAVDDWAATWRPPENMQAGLHGFHNGSYNHEYDAAAIMEPGAANRVEIVGATDTVRFLFNGREMFRAPRPRNEPYRILQIDSFCGVEISDVEIDCEAGRPARAPTPRGGKLLLAATVDFADDILEAPYTARMLDALVRRLHGLGIRRVYWLHSIRVRPASMGSDIAGAAASPRLFEGVDDRPYQVMGRNLAASASDCYPFLPKVCDAAHALGMEVYSVHKPFDLGFHRSRGVPSLFCHDQFQNEHPEALLERWMPPDYEQRVGRPVATIKLFKNDAAPHAVAPAHLSVWVSDDNQRYRRLDTPLHITLGTERKRFPRLWEGGTTGEREAQVITIGSLHITQKYFAVVYDGPRNGTFRNRVYRLSAVLDAGGESVPFTRNLSGLPAAGPQSWGGDIPFVFRGFTTDGCPTGCWRGQDRDELFLALDGPDVGLAFMRGFEHRLRGMPSPAAPAAHGYWTEWVQDALDAGVDGVDLRIVHHNNILDWSNYGFGPLVTAEFRQRFGRELRPDISCRGEHMALLGEMYTRFVRAASGMTRAAGRKFVHHVSGNMDTGPQERGMGNMHWAWRQWIEEGLLDGITLKSMASSSAIADEAMALADARGIETMFCPYANCFFSYSQSWQSQVSDILDAVRGKGMDGFILYETAAFLRAKESGDVVLAYPELRDLLNPP